MTDQLTQLAMPLVGEQETVSPALDAHYPDPDRLPDVVCLDIETETAPLNRVPTRDFGLSYTARPKLIAVAWWDGEKMPMFVATPRADGEFDERAIDWLKRVYETKTIIAHNATFDIRGLSRLKGMERLVPSRVWDTMIMEKLINPLWDKSYALIEVAEGYGLKIADSHKEMKSLRHQDYLAWDPRLVAYAAADAGLTLQIYQRQIAQVADDLMRGLVDWEQRMVRTLAEMSVVGVRVDLDYLQTRLAELGRKRADLSQLLRDDGLFNPASPKARVKWLYERKKIPKPDVESADYADFVTAKGELSASTDVIEKLVDNYPEIRALSDWLKVDKMIDQLEALQDHACVDGRVHPIFSLTETGRRISSHPNLQNVKMTARADEVEGSAAGVFVGDDDTSTLVEIDFSNAENRTAALISGDNALAAACLAKDFHSAMAELYFGDKWTNGDAETRARLRQMGKGVTFGSAYGMGAKSLARKLGINEDEARQILASKDAAFPMVAYTKRLASQKAKETGYVTLWTGRKIPVNPNALYTSWNYLNQGAVSEMTKRSLVLIAEHFRRLGLSSRVVLDMHDALVLCVAKDEVSQALSFAIRTMESVIPDALNRRTDPAMTWIARPDFKKNREKWGKRQLEVIFDVEDANKALDAEKPAENAQTITDPRRLLPAVCASFYEKTTQTSNPDDVRRAVDALKAPKPLRIGGNSTTPPPPPSGGKDGPAFKPKRRVTMRYDDLDWEGSLEFDDQGNLSLTKTIAYFADLKYHVQAQLNKKFKVQLPRIGADGLEIGPVVEVDWENYCLAPLAWLKYGNDAGVMKMIKKKPDDLKTLSEERFSRYHALKDRLALCEKWLDALMQVANTAASELLNSQSG